MASFREAAHRDASIRVAAIQNLGVKLGEASAPLREASIQALEVQQKGAPPLRVP